MDPKTTWHTTLEQAAGLPPSAGRSSALLMARGSMTLRYYAPKGEDRQTPHDQDEVYVVVRGSGTYAVGADETSLERVSFGPGDALFAPAGAVHRFEDFTDDFGTWVIMYGPQGGERPGAS